MEWVAIFIAEIADSVILPHYNNLGKDDINHKIGDEPVTIADKAAENALSKCHLDLLPWANVVGKEEFFANQGLLSRFSGESPVRIVDPIGGTRNFVAGNPTFGVIVALAEQNQTLAGWLYDPFSKQAIVEERGSGANLLNLQTGDESEKLRVQKPDSLEILPARAGLIYATGLPARASW